MGLPRSCRRGVRRSVAGGWCWRAPRQALDGGANRISRTALAHRIEQRGSRTGPAYEGLRIGQHDRVVPRTLDDEWQLKRRRAGLGWSNKGGSALQVEFSRRDRSRTDEPENHGRALDLHILDRHHALVDFQRDRHLVKRRTTAAELAATRQGAPFQPAKQLLDIQARERAVCPGQAGRPVERLRHSEDAVTTAVHGERDIPLAFESAQTEELAEAAFKIDVGEIQLRFDVDPLLEIGERHGALDHAAIGLRLADSQHQSGRYAGLPRSRCAQFWHSKR